MSILNSTSQSIIFIYNDLFYTSLKPRTTYLNMERLDVEHKRNYTVAIF